MTEAGTEVHMRREYARMLNVAHNIADKEVGAPEPPALDNEK